MTYRLAGGTLEVETAIENLSTQPMPLSHGFHTYYQLTDTPRDDWKVAVAAREHVVLNEVLIPTGERKPVSYSSPLSLREVKLDDVFTNLVRGQDGKATFYVEGKRQKISVIYGPKYPVAVIYAPPGREFICFEPMTGVTNAFNLAQAGKYDELQSVPPGKTWRESYWIKPEGF
jgi:aldose 1-epimerase